MRSTSFLALTPIAALTLIACDSSTGQNNCNLPTETASVVTSVASQTGVVNRIKVGGPGNTPGGYNPYTQVDVFVSLPVAGSDAHATVDIVLGKGIPVLVQHGSSAAEPTSACAVHVGDKVTVWAPLDGVFAGGYVTGLGDTVSLSDAAFEAQKLVIDRGK